MSSRGLILPYDAGAAQHGFNLLHSAGFLALLSFLNDTGGGGAGRRRCRRPAPALAGPRARRSKRPSGARRRPGRPSTPPTDRNEDPNTQDVISAERRASWLNEYGVGGAAKAATYTLPLGDLRPASAAGDTLATKRNAGIHWLTGQTRDVLLRLSESAGLQHDEPLTPAGLDRLADAAIAAQQNKGNAA